jgi:hypothetical protein
LPESRVSRVPAVGDRDLTAGLGVYFPGHLHNPLTEIDQRDAGCPAACHVESQGLSDAAGGTGDHRDLSSYRVHIDPVGSRDSNVHELLLLFLKPIVSPFFAFALLYFAVALNSF